MVAKYKQVWLARYPKLLCCFHDQGPKFLGTRFQIMLTLASIKLVSITVKNLQSNVICKCMHQTCANIICSSVLSRPPDSVATAIEMVDSILAATQHVLRCCIHCTFAILLGGLAFQHSMLLPITIATNYEVIRGSC